MRLKRCVVGVGERKIKALYSWGSGDRFNALRSMERERERKRERILKREMMSNQIKRR